MIYPPDTFAVCSWCGRETTVPQAEADRFTNGAICEACQSDQVPDGHGLAIDLMGGAYTGRCLCGAALTPTGGDTLVCDDLGRAVAP